MVDPKTVCFFVPAGLKKFKLNLFDRVADHILKHGGKVIRHKFGDLDRLPPEIIPIIGCSVELSEMVHRWIKEGRTFIYWDRSYVRRVFATWLPRGENGGYYRWHVNAFQLRSILYGLPKNRWKEMRTDVLPWSESGNHIVVAAPTPTYSDFHGTHDWTDRTVAALKTFTKRPIVVRMKDTSKPLLDELKGAHALVAHASNAAVEAVIMGCPVFVDPSSAAALVGKTDLSEIERPIYPDRQPWLNSLAHSQFNERELVDGTLWRMVA